MKVVQDEIGNELNVVRAAISDMRIGIHDLQELRSNVEAIGGLRDDVAAMKIMMQQQQQLMMQMLQPGGHQFTPSPSVPSGVNPNEELVAEAPATPIHSHTEAAPATPPKTNPPPAGCSPSKGAISKHGLEKSPQALTFGASGSDRLAKQHPGSQDSEKPLSQTTQSKTVSVLGHNLHHCKPQASHPQRKG